ncbi:MAG: hypothetical protein IT529_13990 [Burkholderiales bacterium]|nr:hypothetical protein [Burkholderiales bacterium]
MLASGHPSLPTKNLKHLIALARARPGQIDYASGSYGSNSHLIMAHFLSMAKVTMNGVYYKSGNAGLIDALAGRVPVIVGNVLVQLPHVRREGSARSASPAPSARARRPTSPPSPGRGSPATRACSGSVSSARPVFRRRSSRGCIASSSR